MPMFIFGNSSNRGCASLRQDSTVEFNSSSSSGSTTTTNSNIDSDKNDDDNDDSTIYDVVEDDGVRGGTWG